MADCINLFGTPCVIYDCVFITLDFSLIHDGQFTSILKVSLNYMKISSESLFCNRDRWSFMYQTWIIPPEKIFGNRLWSQMSLSTAGCQGGLSPRNPRCSPGSGVPSPWPHNCVCFNLPQASDVLLCLVIRPEGLEWICRKTSQLRCTSGPRPIACDPWSLF